MKTQNILAFVAFLFCHAVIGQNTPACMEFIRENQSHILKTLGCNAAKGWGSRLLNDTMTQFYFTGDTCRFFGNYQATNVTLPAGKFYEGKFDFTAKITSTGMQYIKGNWQMSALDLKEEVWGTRNVRKECLTHLVLKPYLLSKLKSKEIYTFMQWKSGYNRTLQLIEEGSVNSDSLLILGRKTQEMAECIYGKKSQQYFSSTNLLAKIFNAKGQYETGINLMNEIINQCKQFSEGGLPQNATYYLDLAAAYANLGGNAQADKIFQQLVDFFNFQVREEDFNFVTTLHSFAASKMRTNNYAQAATLLERALKLIQKYHNPGTIQLYYLEVKLDLANALAGSNQQPKARLLYDELKVESSKIPPSPPSYGRRNQPDNSAKTIMPGGSSLDSRLLVNTSPDQEDFARRLYTDYGVFLRVNGRNDLSLSALKNAYDLDKQKTKSASSLSCELCAGYDSLNRAQEAIPYFEECFQYQKQKRKEALALSGKRYSMYFAARQEEALNNLMSMAYRHRRYSYYNRAFFDLHAFSRNSLLQNERTLYNSIKSSGNPALIAKYTKLTELRDSLYRGGFSSQAEQASLQNSVNKLENELAEQSAPFRTSAREVSWVDVKQKLKADEAMVLFLRVRTHISHPDSMVYCAIVIHPQEAEPKIVKLCSESALIKKFEGITFDQTAINELYRGGKPLTASNKDQEEAANFLYTLIWKPIEVQLLQTKKIYYALDGLLHRIAFDAIRKPDNSRLLDSYRLRLLSSPKDLVLGLFNQASNKNFRFYLAGGITYASSPNSTPANNNHIFLPNLGITRSLGNSLPPALPGTLVEVNQISKLLQSGYSLKLRTGSDASEDHFKDLENDPQGSPQVIHLATHGFFRSNTPKDDKRKNALLSYENPEYDPMKQLLNAGLLLAGCEAAWLGKPITQKEDGILSALEISNLNLNNTSLVVLSACETGLGDIRGNEGSFGLERAFKMAGVRKMIVSLWEVNDQAAVPFMNTFYSRWLAGAELSEAFYQAKLEAKQKNADPYFWAPFVLIE